MRILLLKRSVQWEKELLSLEFYCISASLFKETICTWRDTYLRELAKKEVAVKTLPNKRPLLLGEELDQQVQQAYITALMVLLSIQLLS